MGCHLLCNDGLGRCMSAFVYAIMLLGNGLVLFTAVLPKFDSAEKTSILVEYAGYAFFWSMMVLSHIFTMCVDPGFIPKDYLYTGGNQASTDNSCTKCKCVKPPKSHHCSTCGRCVLKMDHHCPWMNNCIGLRNQKAFLLFNFYTMVTSLWTVIRVAIAWYDCSENDECDDFDEGYIKVLAIVMLVLCVFFALFTCIMFCDQLAMSL